jgi:hypothetical protein
MRFGMMGLNQKSECWTFLNDVLLILEIAERQGFWGNRKSWILDRPKSKRNRCIR